MKHPEMHKKVKVGNFLGLSEKKRKKNPKISENKSYLKLPELPRNHVFCLFLLGGREGVLLWTTRRTNG